MSDDARDLVMSRHFDAPRARVYRAFTEPGLLAAWFGPVGFTVPPRSVSVDVRVGGRYRLTMVSDADPGFTSPVDAVFTEVVPDQRLVAVEDVAGVAGFEGVARFELALELTDDGDGTRLALRQGPYSAAVEVDARTGWESSFTKLDALLASSSTES